MRSTIHRSRMSQCASLVRGLRGVPPSSFARSAPLAAVRLCGLQRMSEPLHLFAGSHPYRSRPPAATAARDSPAATSDVPQAGAHLEWPRRSHGAGTIRCSHEGEVVEICGWIDSVRDLGGMLFFTARDHTGVLQFIVSEDFPEAAEAAAKLRVECCVKASGKVARRSDPNPNMPTGEVEVVLQQLSILNGTGVLPFSVSAMERSAEVPTEETRLRYRVLDLRRQQMQRNLRLRHDLVRTIRRYLEDEQGFLELETPMLTKSTPEGARDFLVPSRLSPGDFYALPQSPQLFKQLLMVAGFDRYYQLARCFRDEALRADRQPEFTQLDMEMAFLDREAVLSLVEGMISRVFKAILGVELPVPLPRMTYAEAMERYGCDKPDTRFGLELTTVTECVRGCGFKVLAEAVQGGATVRALRVHDGQRLSNARIKPKGDVAEEAIKGGLPGLVYIRVGEGGAIDAAKPVKEGLSPEQVAAMLEACQAQPGDLLLLAAGPASLVNKAMDRVRNFLGESLGGVREGEHKLLWIVDFPMFELNEEENRLQALHHPFTAPHPDDLGDLPRARALAYDLVYNGVEIGGGSLRIYTAEVQKKVFEVIGLQDAEARQQFGFLLDALENGAPPHAGLAFGVDRLAMLLAAAKYGKDAATSIRDVIAFPKTSGGQCLLTGAPASVASDQLDELAIKVSAT